MKNYNTFTSFSVSDMEQAKGFYAKTLGLDEISMEDQGVLMVSTGGDTRFMIYHKENHKPADFTVLNFDVDDLEAVVHRLKNKGVTFERVEEADEKGIAEMGSVRAAWTRDPAGNWIGFFQN
jgi:catechol 2,3-dioxygenase-like lactoylglutathione lyase family enzyme